MTEDKAIDARDTRSQLSHHGTQTRFASVLPNSVRSCDETMAAGDDGEGTMAKYLTG